MNIRKATEGDVKAIQRVAYALKVSGVEWCDWHFLRVIRGTVREGRYYLAELDGKVIGIISLIRGRHRVEIGTLAVKRSFQGKGIGNKLVQFARSFARRCGAKLITVSSLIAYHAKQFYLRLGFRIRSFGLYHGRKWYEFAAAL